MTTEKQETPKGPPEARRNVGGAYVVDHVAVPETPVVEEDPGKKTKTGAGVKSGNKE